jgi:fatty acid/phospholipid biosynthesis enzyme
LICHGGSNARAITSAIRVADQFAKTGLGAETTTAIAEHEYIWNASATARVAEARS